MVLGAFEEEHGRKVKKLWAQLKREGGASPLPPVEDPMDQGGRQVSEEAFLEGPPRREIAIPNGENRLVLADCGPPELGLAYVPVLVHPMLSSRMCG